MKSLDDSNFVHEWNQKSVIILCTECVFFFLVFFCTWRTLGIRMGMKDPLFPFTLISNTVD